jgi:hypothetical protein
VYLDQSNRFEADKDASSRRREAKRNASHGIRSKSAFLLVRYLSQNVLWNFFRHRIMSKERKDFNE